MWHWIGGGALALTWIARAVGAGLGMRKIPDISGPQWDARAEPAPKTSVIVPARNEQEDVAQAITSLLALDYPNLEIVAVNDRSTDDTGAILDGLAAADATGRLRVLHVRELPPDWLGKVHAMWLGAQQATGAWILFTDADVVFRRDSLRRAVAYAERERADHLVLFPTLELQSAGETMMMAFFQSLLAFRHRLWKVADPRTKDHIGVGAFNLIRRSAYEQIGTYAALRLEVVDDMNLGRMVKERGLRQRCVFGRGLLTLRWARGAFGVVENLTKNSFAAVHFKLWKVLAGTLLISALNIGPFAGVLLAPGVQKVGYGLALACIAGMYAGLFAYVGLSPLYFFLHPVATALFSYTLLRSTFLTLRHGGVTWRGTKYPLAALRRFVQ